MSISFFVEIEKYAEKHYIKSFAKKYGRAWELTLEAVLLELQNFDFLLKRSIAEIIFVGEGLKICKVEFKVAGTKFSRHASGNRCIVALYPEKSLIKILLMYSKNDLPSKNETAAWQKIIKENYPEYKDLF